MCRPDFFEVTYKINPWMNDCQVDNNLASLQWTNLKNTLENLDIKVEVIEMIKRQPDMVFSADQAIIFGKNALMSNFKYKERQGETKYYQNWFQSRGYKTKLLPQNVYFEGGGESVWFGDTLLVGIGFRTSKSAGEYIGKTFKIQVVCLELIDPKFYHLDTCLFVLNDQTVFYYPQAFSEKSRIRLNNLVKNLYQLSEKDANTFAANSVVTDHHVILQNGNPSFRSQINALGYKTIELNVSEFLKAGGGIHCLVGEIETKHD
jgi:N-dimethylarginine dimethylaminohydrolase